MLKEIKVLIEEFTQCISSNQKLYGTDKFKNEHEMLSYYKFPTGIIEIDPSLFLHEVYKFWHLHQIKVLLYGLKNVINTEYELPSKEIKSAEIKQKLSTSNRIVYMIDDLFWRLPQSKIGNPSYPIEEEDIEESSMIDRKYINGRLRSNNANKWVEFLKSDEKVKKAIQSFIENWENKDSNNFTLELIQFLYKQAGIEEKISENNRNINQKGQRETLDKLSKQNTSTIQDFLKKNLSYIKKEIGKCTAHLEHSTPKVVIKFLIEELMKGKDINDQKIEEIMTLNLGVFILESERNYELNYISECEDDELGFLTSKNDGQNKILMAKNFGKKFNTKKWNVSGLISTFMNDPFIRYENNLKGNILIRDKNNSFVNFPNWKNDVNSTEKTKAIYSFDKHYLV